MIVGYLKMAFRQLSRSRAYSLINIAGLAIGLAACFVILIYVSYQMSFDKYNERLDDLYLVTLERPSLGWVEPNTPFALAPAVKDALPGVSEAARWGRARGSIRHGDKTFDESALICADPEIFKVLTIPMADGTSPSPGTGADFLVISDKVARKYFGGKNPLGEVLTIECLGLSYNLPVTGVMKDLPPTSTFKADLIAPLRIREDFIAKLYRGSRQELTVSWVTPAVATYLLLDPSANRAGIDAKLKSLGREHQTPEQLTPFSLFPVKDIYFHSASMINSGFVHGSLTNLYIYASAALLLLLVATVNYLMLGLGRASLRTREVGVRKVLGARKLDLFWQITVEAALVTLLALLPALALVELFLQRFTALLGTEISGTYFHAWKFVAGFTVIALLAGLIAGSYIAFYLASLNPAEVLRNKVGGGSRKAVLRRALMGTQMVVFLGLTLASLVFYRQLLYCQQKDPGFDMSRLLVFYPDGRDFPQAFESAKTELRKIPGVIAVSGANIAPGDESRAVMKFPRKDNPAELVQVEGMSVDQDFIETLGLKLTRGETFARRAAAGASSAGVCMVNETLVRTLGFADPVGQDVGGLRVIGVVQDFNLHSLREQIVPVQISQNTAYARQVIVRIASANFQETVQAINATLIRFNAGKTVEFETYDERIEALYRKEQDFIRVIGYAAGLAILVASLGILGMSVFICQQRVKEIGIRKVMGASAVRIYAMVVREFLVLVLAASLIGFAGAVYFVNKWLENFAYRIAISPWDVLAALAANLLVVLAVVTYQALRAARANPVESLRYE